MGGSGREICLLGGWVVGGGGTWFVMCLQGCQFRDLRICAELTGRALNNWISLR